MKRLSYKKLYVAWAVLFVLTAVLGWTGIQLWNRAVYGEISWMLFSAAAFVMLVIFGIGSILFPQLSRFENPAMVLLANTLRLGMANLPLTVGLGLVNAAVVFLCVRYVFPVFFLPALGALISTLFIEPMFKPYMPEAEREKLLNGWRRAVKSCLSEEIK